jgi:hypothetical protein
MRAFIRIIRFGDEVSPIRLAKDDLSGGISRSAFVGEQMTNLGRDARPQESRVSVPCIPIFGIIVGNRQDPDATGLYICLDIRLD